MASSSKLRELFLDNADLQANIYFVISALSFTDYYRVGFYTAQILIGVGLYTMKNAADELIVVHTLPPENMTSSAEEYGTENFFEEDYEEVSHRKRDISVPQNWSCPYAFYSGFDGCTQILILF